MRHKMKGPALAATAGDEAKTDRVDNPIVAKTKQPRRQKQPLAIARDFGVCFAVFVRDKGIESRVGLYSNAGAAAAAAASLNVIFAEGSA